MYMLATAASCVIAQDVVKEVAGIRDFEPDKRKATRLETVPSLITVDEGVVKPSFNSRLINIAIEPSISRFNLLPEDYIYKRDDTRGYAALGYFPKGDIDLSAGYRLLDKRDITADIWTQFDRNYYHGQFSGEERKYRITTTDLAVGANLSWLARGRGVLRASTSYMYDHFNYPLGSVEPESQSINRFRVNADWDGKAGERFRYGINASVIYFGNRDAIIPEGYTVVGNTSSPLCETTWKAGAYGRYRCSRKVSLFLDINYQEASLDRSYTEEYGQNLIPSAGVRKGVLSLTPRVDFTGRKMDGYLGLNFSVPTGYDSGLKIGEEAAWNWLISNYFAINARVTSGPMLNTLEQMYHISRYASPLSTPGVSYVPFDFDISLNLLSFKGFSLSAGCGYSWVTDRVMPALFNGMSALEISDLHTAIYFVKAGYEYGETLAVEASFTGASGDSYERAYYKWQDRATRVVSVSVDWHPGKNVTLSVGYDYRSGRKVLSGTTSEGSYGIDEIGFKSLGDISGVSVRAHWNISNAIGVYGRVEGIGQKKYLQVSGLPGQRLKPLVGLTVKF